MKRSVVFTSWLSVCLVLAASPNTHAFELNVPSHAVTRAGDAIVLSPQTFNSVSLKGDLGTEVTVTLSADEGTINVAKDTGVSFTTGTPQGEQTMTFKGTPKQVQAALDGLTYVPQSQFVGRAKITVAVASAESKTTSFYVTVNQIMDAKEARNQILSGVTEIHSGVQPGYMVAYGPEAYDIAYYNDTVEEGPIIAAATWGAGRVIAVPDHQMLNYTTESGMFYKNGIQWLANSPGLDVNIVTRSQKTADWLTTQGYSSVTVFKKKDTPKALTEADVFFAGWLGSSESAENMEAIGSFVRAGGGLFIAEYGVGYKMWWKKPIYDAPGNHLLRDAGIGFTGGNHWDNSTISIKNTVSGQLNATELVSLLNDPGQASDKTLTRAGVLFGRIYDALNPDDPIVKQLDSEFWDYVMTIVPTPKTPVSSTWEKGMLKREAALLEQWPVEQVTKHRTTEGVFGAVPDDAQRLSKTVTIDTKVTRWHSTGVYAPPGEVITIQVPETAVDTGIKIRISGHTDNISVRPKWLRMPTVARSQTVTATEFKMASPYGGALYVDVGTKNTELGSFDVTFSGVVEAPYFVLGQTTDQAWVDGIRDNPAPFAELVAPNVAISLPSSFIRKITDPSVVMQLWNAVVTAQDELGQHANLRTNGERINIDVQVSAGYLHAGYPTQGPTKSADIMANSSALKAQGSWGWFHELGHEAQRRPDKSWGWNNIYTFDGSVEATVNIFTKYAYDTLGIVTQGGWGWTSYRVATMKKALDGLEGGQTYAEVNVGVKLAMFLELRDHFGWAAFKTVFNEYNTVPKTELPQNEQQERDQWLVRFSNAVGYNLTQFLESAWKLTLSDDAKAQVASLPDWMPAIGGIEGDMTVGAGFSANLPLTKAALSHDGVATIKDVTKPQNGTLAKNNDGVWIYTPNVGYVGADEISYTVVSSTGFESKSTIAFNVTPNGALTHVWKDITGSSVSDLTQNKNYPDNPTQTLVTAGLKWPEDWGDNYGVRMRSFIIPPTTGKYRFWIASDDSSELFLSSDHLSKNAELVASVDGYTNPEQWGKQKTQKSNQIELTQGKAYYIEVLMKEGGGGDHLSVAWALANGEPSPIPNAALRFYKDNNKAPSAGADTAQVEPGNSVTIDLLKNDTDPDNDPLYVAIVTNSEGKPVENNGDGTFTFKAPKTFKGSVTFKYTVADGYGGEAQGTITINSNLGDDSPPTAWVTVPEEDTLLACADVELKGMAKDQGTGPATVELQLNFMLPKKWEQATLSGQPGDLEREWVWNIKNPGSGSHIVYLRSIDLAGNVQGKVTVHTFDVDCTGPKKFWLTQQSPVNPQGWTCNDRQVTVGWEATKDTEAGLAQLPYEVWLDGVAVSPRVATTTLTLENLSDGSHTWAVRAYDAQDNWTEAKAKAPLGGFGIDCDAPAAAKAFAALVYGTHVPDNALVTTAELKANDTVTMKAQGTVCFGACNESYSDTATCIDAEGITGGTPYYSNIKYGAPIAQIGSNGIPIYIGDSAKITVDAPGELKLAVNSSNSSICPDRWFEVTTHASPGFGPWFPTDGHMTGTATPTFSWATGDDATSIAVLVDGSLLQALEEGQTSVTLPAEQALTHGKHTWQVKATDAAGNVALSDEWSFEVDLKGPAEFAVQKPTVGSVVVDDTEICWAETTDDGTGVVHYELWMNDKLVSAHAPGSNCAKQPLDDGTYCVVVKALDRVGNATPTDTHCFTVDTAGPVVASGLIPTDGACVDGNKITLGWDPCVDNGTGIGSVEIWVNDEAFVTELDSKSISTEIALPQGEHTWFVRCIDNGGLHSDSKPQLLLSDTTPPEFTRVTVSATGGITVEASEPGPCALSSVEVKIDGGDYEPAQAEGAGWKLVPSTLSDGRHTMNLLATDGANNTTSIKLIFGIGACWANSDCSLDDGECGEPEPAETACDDDPCTTDVCDPDSATCDIETIEPCCGDDSQCDGTLLCIDNLCAEPEPIEPSDGGDATADSQDSRPTVTGNSDSGCQQGPTGQNSTHSPMLLMLMLLVLLGTRRRSSIR